MPGRLPEELDFVVPNEAEILLCGFVTLARSLQGNGEKEVTVSVFFVSLIRVAAGRSARSLQQHTMQPGNTEDNVLLEPSNCMSHPAKPGVYVRAINVTSLVGAKESSVYRIDTPNEHRRVSSF